MTARLQRRNVTDYYPLTPRSVTNQNCLVRGRTVITHFVHSQHGSLIIVTQFHVRRKDVTPLIGQFNLVPCLQLAFISIPQNSKVGHKVLVSALDQDHKEEEGETNAEGKGEHVRTLVINWHIRNS